MNLIDIKYFKIAVGQANIGKESATDIVARCPICGDSQKNKRSKRLHLYEKAGETRVNCFNGNCAVTNKNMYAFLKNFYPSLFDSYKRENFQETLSSLSNKESSDVFADIKIIKEKPVISHNLFEYFSDVKNHNDALVYLGNRGYFYNEQFGKFYFGIQDLQIGDKLYKITNCIIIPLYFEEEMYGFYSRNISNKEFWTYMPEQNIGYKIAFWFNIDKSKETLITEGIFDCLSINYSNKIALMGAKIPEERLKELKNPLFVLDNDKTGILNSIEYAKRGYNVFVQPNEYKEKDMNELMLNHPELDIYKMIKENTFTGIMAEVRLKSKL